MSGICFHSISWEMPGQSNLTRNLNIAGKVSNNCKKVDNTNLLAFAIIDQKLGIYEICEHFFKNKV